MEELVIKKWVGTDVRRGIKLAREKDVLEIFFAGNLDLYFSFTSFCNHSSFIISKDNYDVWEIFDKLYQDLINARFFVFTSQDKERVVHFSDVVDEDYHEKLRYEENFVKEMNENLKKYDSYRRLVNNGEIRWGSDDFYYDVAPYFTLKPLKEHYELSFGVPLSTRKLDGHEEFILEGCKHGTITVRLRNSGSNYDPFNLVFMRLFNSLMELEEDYHQIHIEEYLLSQFELNRTLRK